MVLVSIVFRLTGFVFFALLLLSFECSAQEANLQWTEAYKRDDVQVWSAQDENGKTWVKAQTLVDAPYWALLNLLRDTQSAADWIDNLIYIELMPGSDKFTDLVYTEFYAPWPFKNRNMNTKSTLLWSDSEATLSIHVKQHPMLKSTINLVTMEQVQGIWVSEQQENKRNRITWTGTASPGGNIPDWLARSEIKKSTFNTFLALTQKITEKKYQEKPSAYPQSH